MRYAVSAAFTAALSLASLSSGLNIILNNDDGFGSANIREFYRLLNAAGHNAWIVAPVNDQSGMGGRSVFTSSSVLTAASEDNLVPAGAPSIGTDPFDKHIWYYNGTPAACTFVALDYVVPNFWNGTTPDLLVSGPNFGTNLGPFLYTLSGTIAAAYAAVERSLPAIAFSASNSAESYLQVNSSSNPATVAAKLAVSLVNQLAANTKHGKPLLPLGYGISVNFPETTGSCMKPPFIQTRLTGGADVDFAAFNKSSGTFHYANVVPAGANTCINGDCSLPGETLVVNGGCASSVSLFTVDYDAPTSHNTTAVRKSLEPLVQYQNSTTSLLKKRDQTRYSRG